MGRLARAAAVLLVAASVCGLGGLRAEELVGLADVAQYGLPTPPMQRAPWTPPAGKLGNAFADAVATLCQMGLPDPRGCEYREVDVPQLYLRGEMQYAQTHGWVLPPGPGNTAFAICWDGLIYPVIGVGKPADLNADVAAAIQREEKYRADSAEKYPGRKFSLGWNANVTLSALDPDRLYPLRACLLLRLGQAELAERVWQMVLEDYGGTFKNGMQGDDPYLVFATDWAWAKCQRARICASQGFSPVALADLTELDKLRQPLADVAVGRGYPREWVAYLLRFMDSVPVVLADQRRRASVGELIHDLEYANIHPHSTPGGLDYSDSLAVVQLVLLGDAAVEPLLAAIDSDERLSLSSGNDRPWVRSGGLTPVREFEWAAVRAILGSPPLSDTAHVRAWWEANRGRSPLERLYATLADDGAGTSMWLWAARNVARPDDEPVRRLGFLGGRPADYDPSRPPKWTGEPLRDGRHPSVSEVMAARTASIAQAASGDPRSSGLRDATTMAVQLARWDPQAALPALRALNRSWHNALGRGPGDAHSGYAGDGSSLADLALARLHCGDDQALHDYAAWVQADRTRDTRPLWLASDDPDVVSATTTWLAEHAPSPGSSEDPAVEPMPSGPMLAVQPFRAYLLRQLRNDDPAGNIVALAGGGYSRDFPGWTGPSPKERPAAGTKVLLRVKDSVAWNLSSLPGFPKLNPFAPIEERDRVTADCARILQEKGEGFSKTIDRDAFWTQWLRKRDTSYGVDLETVFKPERALSGD